MTYVSDKEPAEYLRFNNEAGAESRDKKCPELVRDASGRRRPGGPAKYPYNTKDLQCRAE